MEYSRLEKILASLFVAFLLLASINFLRELENIPQRPDYTYYQEKYGITPLLENQSRLMELNRGLYEGYKKAESNLTEVERVYLFKREEYRVALESGNATKELEQEYLKAKEEYEKAYLKYLGAKSAYDDVHNKLQELSSQIQELMQNANEEYNRAYQVYRLKVLMLKLAFVLPIFVISLLLLRKYKNIYTSSLIAYSALLLIYLTLSAIWNIVHIIGISLFGAVATLAALYYLRKEYFKPERVYKRRIAQNKCYNCGFPIKDDYLNCPNCGAKLKEKCEHCGALKPIHLQFCPYCGQ
ncbi:MAG TPA: zinc ribbon domain-containing protein [Thermococcus sp.]|uniref:zinc ribbon domain-containing protein n=1 Tax=Thermococcus sp. TaxID=35749 RepID=UPI000F29992B|nr:zinc ribbon domain-containing protein [Thermococcus sp.]MCD6143150.1 zinc ribbon domain-containing protein [Thermococcus sp.]RLF82290.1 MAG: zinc ribbon domain-containing protein [Thermococci archaeon]RLF87347.1 MAG: zinc ribbon domain-containing protein [Thermococci archaeon]HDH45367.1 zinc ribbon domain-containing protein [Thermococcus sp.]